MKAKTKTLAEIRKIPWLSESCPVVWNLVPFWRGVREASDWSIIFNVVPLPESKIKVLEKKGDKHVVIGVMVDHLMKVARMIGIPNVYIQEIVDCRYRYRRYRSHHGNITEAHARLMKKTAMLRRAVADSLDGFIGKD
jgi:hypothetical protein